jgi:hypothetical protein
MTKSENRCKGCRHLLKHHNSSGKCGWKYAFRQQTCDCQMVSQNEAIGMERL